MKREELYYVLFEQQREFQKKREFIDRTQKNKIIELLKLKLPIVITGVRRCGKSTLIYILKKHLQLKEKEWLYLNFNDERLSQFSIEDFQKIIDYLNEKDYEEKCFLFIDEIQEVGKWEKWIDRIKEKYQIIITGSNSKLLSKEISTILTGRSINVSLYPFSFMEFINAKNILLKNWEIDLKLQAKIRKEFSLFMLSGGIPKRVTDNDDKILQENYENILYRDIIKRFNANLEKTIKEISVYMLSNISKELSLRSLSKTVEVKNLSTLKSILDTFEKAFVIFFINKFDYSIRKQIKNPKKIYCIDNGFIAQGGFRFSDDDGKLLENLVFIELKRIYNNEIYYFSEKNECDFILRTGNKVIKAIQVCYDLNNENKEREINGLLEAINKFGLNEGLILTFDKEEEIKIGNKKIKIKPAWKWLLSNN
ncbi:ATP-binding protein [Candidatus Woesearchaeota archaeon]|nr:ATP-binding protein [Candidatus Woesearchaeota archaeon]